MKNSRVLAVHRYFYPDSSPYGNILHEMVKYWRNEGNLVDVISSMPNYTKTNNSIDNSISRKEYSPNGLTKRLDLFREKGRSPIFRIINVIVLLFSLSKQLITQKTYDYVISSTTPPVLIAFFISFGARIFKYRFIYHYMDIHPEIGKPAGHYSNKLVYALLFWMDNFAAEHAYRCVVLSEDMKRSLLKRNQRIQARNVYVINNFGMQNKSVNRKAIIEYKVGDLNVIYAGNIGIFQSLDIIIQGLRLLKESDRVFFHVVGDGTERERLEILCKDYGMNNVRFYGQVSSAQAQQAIGEADIAYLSVSEEILSYAFPSKFSSYLIQGTPVLASASPETELANILESEQLGMGVQLNSESISKALRELSINKKLIDKWRRNAIAKSGDLFGKERYFREWQRVFEESDSTCS